jgi:hypothetical protein
VVLVNNARDGMASSAPNDTDPTITIPTIGISKEDGDKIKAKLMAGTAVNLRMVGPPVYARRLAGQRHRGA